MSNGEEVLHRGFYVQSSGTKLKFKCCFVFFDSIPVIHIQEDKSKLCTTHRISKLIEQHLVGLNSKVRVDSKVRSPSEQNWRTIH